jgi:Domain of unknown function (DUF4389)
MRVNARRYRERRTGNDADSLDTWRKGALAGIALRSARGTSVPPSFIAEREVIMEPYDKTVDAEGEDRSARSAIWMRGLFMLLLMLAFGVGQGLLWLLAVVQFLWLIFTEAPNAFLVRFGKSLSAWLAETARFVTCASETKPFPWAAWPSAD